MSRASGGGERRRSRTTILKKEQMTQMNCLQLLIQSTLFHLNYLQVDFFFLQVLYLESRSLVTDPRLNSLSVSDYATHFKLILAEIQVSAQTCITNEFTTC